MLNIMETPVVWWPVTINVPRDGGVDAVEVQVQYELLDRDEIERIAKESDEAATARLFEAIKDWQGFGNADGVAVAFTREAFDAAIRKTYIAKALADGLINASYGAVEKN